MFFSTHFFAPRLPEEAKKDDTDTLDTPDKKPECVRGMKALSRPFSVACPF